MDTKITQDPQIAASIIKQILGNSPEGVTINVITIGTITMGSPTQDNSNNHRQIEHRVEKRVVRQTDGDVIKALKECNWNQSKAARLLEMRQPVINGRVKKMGGIEKLKSLEE